MKDIINRIVNASIEERNKVPSSKTIIREIKNKYPTILKDWLDENADQFLRAYISRTLSHRRSRLAISGKLDDLQPEKVFDIVQAVPGSGFKRIGELTAEDCQAISSGYQQVAETSLALSTFYAQLSTEIGDRTVEEALKPQALIRRMENAKVRYSPHDGMPPLLT